MTRIFDSRLLTVALILLTLVQCGHQAHGAPTPDDQATANTALLALTLCFTNSKFSEDAVSDSRIGRLRRLVDAYDRGLVDPLTGIERAALPLAIARQPLWWVGRRLALLDDEAETRRGFAGVSRDLEWSLQVIRKVERWQSAFA